MYVYTSVCIHDSTSDERSRNAYNNTSAHIIRTHKLFANSVRCIMCAAKSAKERLQYQKTQQFCRRCCCCWYLFCLDRNEQGWHDGESSSMRGQPTSKAKPTSISIYKIYGNEYLIETERTTKSTCMQKAATTKQRFLKAARKKGKFANSHERCIYTYRNRLSRW